jgi:hypothetical protein
MCNLFQKLFLVLLIILTPAQAKWEPHCNLLLTVYTDYQNYKLNLHRVDVAWPEVPTPYGYRLYWGPGAAYFTEMLDVQTATSASIFVPANMRWFFCVAPYDTASPTPLCPAVFDTLVPAKIFPPLNFKLK